MIDGSLNTTYTGIVGEQAEVEIEFHKELTLTGFKYTVMEGTPVGSYSIWLRDGTGEWKETANGTFDKTETQSVYFTEKNSKNIASYHATAARLVIKGQRETEIAVSELDVLGVTGDNVDFRRTGEQTAAIGRLEADYQYGENAEDVIPAGSVVFTGAYKGNPSYNVVLLYDQNGNLVGSRDMEGALKADQIILAEVPDSGNVRDVSDGTWIYWISPEDTDCLKTIEKVRAELYRVDNAETNEGQRMVSDSLFERMPKDLPVIQLSGGK